MTDAPSPRQPRPATPTWLRAFAHKLYDSKCILCGATRPLKVAHLANWTAVKKAVIEYNAQNAPLNYRAEDAFWLFHRPWNVVLLCSSCHDLFDGKQYIDVTRADILAARDRALATQRAALTLREYLCRGWTGTVGSAQHGNYILRWFPLVDRLKAAYEAGLLPPPHRFLLCETEMVDVTQALITNPSDGEDLPIWTGRKFVPLSQLQTDSRPSAQAAPA